LAISRSQVEEKKKKEKKKNSSPFGLLAAGKKQKLINPKRSVTTGGGGCQSAERTGLRRRGDPTVGSEKLPGKKEKKKKSF